MDNLVAIFQAHLKSDFSLLVLALCYLGGLVASLSPCGIGVLPVVVSYIGGYSKEKTSTTALQMISFLLGLSLCLTVVGIICALTGKVFGGGSSPYWVLFLASLIFIFGLNLVGVMDINFPVLVKSFPQNTKHSTYTYPMLLGAVFALATTPCSTPILAGIMATASLSANIAYSALMLFLFSLGQGTIIVFAGIFTSFLKNLKSFARLTEILTKASGIILVLFAIFLYYKVFSNFM